MGQVYSALAEPSSFASVRVEPEGGCAVVIFMAKFLTYGLVACFNGLFRSFNRLSATGLCTRGINAGTSAAYSA